MLDILKAAIERHAADAGFYQARHESTVHWAKLAREAIEREAMETAKMWLEMIAELAATPRG